MTRKREVQFKTTTYVNLDGAEIKGIDVWLWKKITPNKVEGGGGIFGRRQDNRILNSCIKTGAREQLKARISRVHQESAI